MGCRGVCALALALSGCASYGSHLAASTLPPSENEVSLNADVLVIDRGLGPQVLPNPELGYRFGVSSNLDLGGRVNAGSLELNARWRFVQHAAFDLALVPALGFGFVPATNEDTGTFNAHLLGSALAGLHLSARSQLVLGPRGGFTYAFPLTAFRGDATGDNLFYQVGGVLGVRFPVSEGAFLFPDVNVLWPYDTRRDEWHFPTLQGGVALQF